MAAAQYFRHTLWQLSCLGVLLPLSEALTGNRNGRFPVGLFPGIHRGTRLQHHAERTQRLPEQLDAHLSAQNGICAGARYCAKPVRGTGITWLRALSAKRLPLRLDMRCSRSISIAQGLPDWYVLNVQLPL